MTTIVDYGCGNIGSIQNMLKKLGEESLITSDSELIDQATRLILPGVGSFDTGVNNLKNHNLISCLNKKVLDDRIPILGICLGFQLMTNSSTEGSLEGLGWFDAETIKFDLKDSEKKFPLPNIGWRKTNIHKEIPLYSDVDDDTWFYYVHNYHVTTNDEKLISLTSTYAHDYIAALTNKNILGVQFHPEKSHKYGLRLFDNFLTHY